jgi:hypothetical protein
MAAKKKTRTKKNTKTTTRSDKNPTISTEERRAAILEAIEEFGAWNINKSALAENFGVHRSTIYEDLKVIYDQLRPEDLNETFVSLRSSLGRAIQVLDKDVKSRNANVRIQASRALGKLSDHYTNLLESYGAKNKVAERVEVSAGASYEEVERRIKEALNDPHPPPPPAS